MKKLRKQKIIAILGSVLLTSATYPASAKTPAVYNLNPIIVTATRTEKKDLSIPAYSKIITQEEIENKGSIDLTDLLEKETSINSYAHLKDYGDITPANSRFYIRGLDKGTLVLLNGAPVSFNNFNASLIPPESIKKIEIIKGANSVLYGAEAMGGVVNIITKTGASPKTELSLTGGSAKKKWSINSEGENYYINITRNYIDEYNHARFRKKQYTNFTGYTKNNLFSSLKLTDQLSLNYLHSESIRGGYGVYDAKGKRNGAGYEYDNKFDSASLSYQDTIHHFNSTLTYNRKRLDWRKIEKTGIYSNGSATSNYILNSWNFDINKNFILSKKQNLLIGGTFHREEYEQLRNKNNATSRNSFALFSSYDYQVSNKLNLIFGFRTQFDEDDGFTGKKNVFLPQLQTLYKINNQTSWYTNIGKSFEMPPLNAQFAKGRSKANKDLSPQEGWTYETGLKHINEIESYKLSLFYMDFKNKFAWETYDILGITPPAGTSGDTYLLVNRGKFRNLGIEFEYDKKINKFFNTTIRLTLQNPRSKERGAWVQESSRIQGKIGLNYKQKKFNAGVHVLYTADREGGLDYEQLPSSLSMNAIFGYKINDNQTFTLNLNNLLDRRNIANSSQYMERPFNWAATYKVTF